MKRKKKVFFFIFVFIFFCFSLLYSAIYEQGENFYKDVKMRSGLMGTVVDLSKILEGKNLLILGMLSTCPHCEHELEDIVSLMGDYEGLLQVVLVLFDYNDTVIRKIGERFGKVFVFLPGYITKMVNLDSVPYIVLTDTKGNVLYQFSGYIPKSKLKRYLDKITSEYSE